MSLDLKQKWEDWQAPLFLLFFGLLFIGGIYLLFDSATADCSSYSDFWQSVDADDIVYKHPNGSVAYTYEDRPEQINMTVRNSYYYRCKLD